MKKVELLQLAVEVATTSDLDLGVLPILPRSALVLLLPLSLALFFIMASAQNFRIQQQLSLLEELKLLRGLPVQVSQSDAFLL